MIHLLLVVALCFAAIPILALIQAFRINREAKRIERENLHLERELLMGEDE